MAIVAHCAKLVTTRGLIQHESTTRSDSLMTTYLSLGRRHCRKILFRIVFVSEVSGTEGKWKVVLIRSLILEILCEVPVYGVVQCVYIPRQLCQLHAISKYYGTYCSSEGRFAWFGHRLISGWGHAGHRVAKLA